MSNQHVKLIVFWSFLHQRYLWPSNSLLQQHTITKLHDEPPGHTKKTSNLTLKLAYEPYLREHAISVKPLARVKIAQSPPWFTPWISTVPEAPGWGTAVLHLWPSSQCQQQCQTGIEITETKKTGLILDCIWLLGGNWTSWEICTEFFL